MILPDFVLPSRVHQQWDYSGMDSIELCFDKKYFLSYPHKVHYSYNSRGFRDEEWPSTLNELKNAVWCVGDSFTVGVGQPFDHIWPQVLSKKLDRRIINVSMDGASNQWIARRVQTIVDTIHPRYIVVLWSYTHRREHANQLLDDEQRRIPYLNTSAEDDYSNWLELLESINPSSTKIVHSTIPDFHPIINYTDIWNDIKDQSWPACPRNITDFENLPKYILDEIKNVHGYYDEIRNQLESNIIHIHKRLDWARDYHHFDILTAQWLVGQICDQLPN